MKKLREILREERDKDFRTDNPGKEWLARKKASADEDYSKSKGLRGAVTGYYKGNIKMKTDDLHKLPGANGEHNFRDSGPKQDSVSNMVGHPSKFNTKEYPLMVGVNHRGEAHVMEGNHRLAYAKKHGIPHVHTEFKYYNGGEEVDGPHHPSKVAKMRVHDSD